jgi:hypothetical protein
MSAPQKRPPTIPNPLAEPKIAAKDNCPSGIEDCAILPVAQPGPGTEVYVVSLVGDRRNRRATYYPPHLRHPASNHCQYKSRVVGMECTACGRIFDKATNAGDHSICQRNHYQCVICQSSHTTVKNFKDHTQGKRHTELAVGWVFEPRMDGGMPVAQTGHTGNVVYGAQPYGAPTYGTQTYGFPNGQMVAQTMVPETAAQTSDNPFSVLLQAALGGEESSANAAQERVGLQHVPGGQWPSDGPSQTDSAVVREENARQWTDLELNKPPESSPSVQFREQISEVETGSQPIQTLSAKSDVAMESGSG